MTTVDCLIQFASQGSLRAEHVKAAIDDLQVPIEELYDRLRQTSPNDICEAS